MTPVETQLLGGKRCLCRYTLQCRTQPSFNDNIVFYAFEIIELNPFIIDLYYFLQEFKKEDLRQLLQQIRESSLHLLDQNKDPLGYELV